MNIKKGNRILLNSLSGTLAHWENFFIEEKLTHYLENYIKGSYPNFERIYVVMEVIQLKPFSDSVLILQDILTGQIYLFNSNPEDIMLAPNAIVPSNFYKDILERGI